MAALLIVEQKEGRNVRKKARMRGRDKLDKKWRGAAKRKWQRKETQNKKERGS